MPTETILATLLTAAAFLKSRFKIRGRAGLLETATRDSPVPAATEESGGLGERRRHCGEREQATEKI
jgi:hypothetical protein